MPDISMCRGDYCPFKLRCYRFTAIPSEMWQAYFAEIPYNVDLNNCDHFWVK